MSFSLWRFFVEQCWSPVPDVPPSDLSDRTVLITGVASLGLGLEAASQLLSYNPKKLIIGNRRLNSAEESKAELLRRHPSIKSEVIECWSLDLLDFESIRTFAKRANDELERLDILVLNAGMNVGFRKSLPELSKDGFERTTQTNAISTVLLPVLLAPLLKRTASLPLRDQSDRKPHIVFVGSDGHYHASIKTVEGEGPLRRMNDPLERTGNERYMTSKLFLQLMVHKLIQLYPEFAITSIHPGLCKTNIGREIKPDEGAFAMWIVNKIAIAPAEGAKVIVYAATQPKDSVKFISFCTEREPLAFTTSKKGIIAQEIIWNEVVDIWKAAAILEVPF